MESLPEQTKAVIAKEDSKPPAPISCPSVSKPSLKRKREQTEEEVESLGARVEDIIRRVIRQRDNAECLLADAIRQVEKWKYECKILNQTCERRVRQRDDAISQRDDALRQKADAISHAADAIREKDDVICRLDNALGTKCEICHNDDYERCFLGKICANDCNHKCCIQCLLDMGFNNHHGCPWCRGELSSDALQDLRNLDRKLRTQSYLSRPTTPRNRVLDSLHSIMQGQLPDLTPQQVSRRLDDLFAHTEAPIPTVTEMFEAALPPAPETPTANVSGSNTTVINGTTYYFD